MTEIWQTPSWPRFIYDKAEAALLLLDIAKQQGEINGLHAGLGADEREEILLREIAQEAVHSFGIEGVKLDAAEVEASVVASLKARNLEGATRRSDAVAELMLDAREPGLALDEARLKQWHALLFRGMEIEDLGTWRRFDIVIVKSARADQEDVLYKPVSFEQVGHEMDMFLSWIKDTSEPVPIRAAIAHLWFESIHPFSDGNGRIGRAVIEHVFAQSEALPFSLSRQIELEKKAYYAALQAGRVATENGIDASEFVNWFLRALLSAGKTSIEEALFLVVRNRFFITHRGIGARAEMVLRRLFAEGAERVGQGVSAKAYSKISGVSAATATRDLVALEGQGALMRSEEGGRSTRYFLTL